MLMKRHLGRALAPLDDNATPYGGSGGASGASSIDVIFPPVSSPTPVKLPVASVPASVVTPPVTVVPVVTNPTVFFPKPAVVSPIINETPPTPGIVRNDLVQATVPNLPPVNPLSPTTPPVGPAKFIATVINDEPLPTKVQAVQANVGVSSSPSATVSTLTSSAPVAALSNDAQSFIDNTKSNLVQAAQTAETTVKNDPKKAIMIVGGVLLLSGILYAATRKKKSTT